MLLSAICALAVAVPVAMVLNRGVGIHGLPPAAVWTPGILGVLMLLASVRANHSVVKAFVALPTKVLTVGLFVALLLLSLMSVLALAQSKDEGKHTKRLLAATSAGSGAGAAMAFVFIRKLIHEADTPDINDCASCYTSLVQLCSGTRWHCPDLSIRLRPFWLIGPSGPGHSYRHPFLAL